MKLLQHAWSDLLILDHLHQRLHNHLPDESSLPNGQKFDLLSLSLLGCPNLVEPLHDVTNRLTEIRFDVPDYVCLKFLMLLNSGTGSLFDISAPSSLHSLKNNKCHWFLLFFSCFLSSLLLLFMPSSIAHLTKQMSRDWWTAATWLKPRSKFNKPSLTTRLTATLIFL